MGCDAFANKNGVFEIEVRDYERDANGQMHFYPKRIRLVGLKPEHPLAIEIIEGEHR